VPESVLNLFQSWASRWNIAVNSARSQHATFSLNRLNRLTLDRTPIKHSDTVKNLAVYTSATLPVTQKELLSHFPDPPIISKNSFFIASHLVNYMCMGALKYDILKKSLIIFCNPFYKIRYIHVYIKLIFIFW